MNQVKIVQIIISNLNRKAILNKSVMSFSVQSCSSYRLGCLGSSLIGHPLQNTFSFLFWDLLSSLGYTRKPMYMPKERVELGVPRCQISVSVVAPPDRPVLIPLEMEVSGYRVADTRPL